MRLAWLTDIHLNFFDDDSLDVFCDCVAGEEPDAVLIGGDIGEANDVVGYLEFIDDRLKRPLHFVLGNHDYYHGSIAEVRRLIARLCDRRANLTYLSDSTAIALSDSVALVGHDGWADARAGNYDRSTIMLNDYVLIEDFFGLDTAARREKMHQLAGEAAAHIHEVLPAALQNHQHVFLLTHVPPLHEACWHDGHLSDDEWAPHFTCLAMGEAILQIMREQPQRQLTVLCGHTHSEGECRPLDNVHIITGGAEYHMPQVQRVFEIS